MAGEGQISPDGRTRVDYGYTQGRMSHEIYSPKITDVATGQVLLDLMTGSEPWDGSVEWLGNGDCSVNLRHYYEGGRVSLHVHLFRSSGTFSIDSGAPERMEQIRSRVLQAFYEKTMRLNPPQKGSWEEEWLEDLIRK
jgi:hypothetical protein